MQQTAGVDAVSLHLTTAAARWLGCRGAQGCAQMWRMLQASIQKDKAIAAFPQLRPPAGCSAGLVAGLEDLKGLFQAK